MQRAACVCVTKGSETLERDNLIARLADVLRGAAMRTLTVEEIADKLDAIAMALRKPEQLDVPGTSADAKAQRKSDADNIRLVFDYWRTKTGHLTARLHQERAQKIRARLRTFTPEQLFRAIDGVMMSGHHTGDNESGEDYTWIESIFRNGSQVEKHLARAGGIELGESLEPENPEADRLRQEIEAAQERGDVEHANELNRQLRLVLLGSGS